MKMYFLFKMVIFHCYVSLPECNHDFFRISDVCCLLQASFLKAWIYPSGCQWQMSRFMSGFPTKNVLLTVTGWGGRPNTSNQSLPK